MPGKCDNQKLSTFYWYREKFIDIAREFNTISMPISYRIEINFDTISNIDIDIENYHIVSIDFDIFIEILSIETIKILKLVKIGSSGYPNRSICFDNSIENYQICIEFLCTIDKRYQKSQIDR